MATTAIWDVTDRLKRVLDYAANPDKTTQERAGGEGLKQVLAYTQGDVKTEKQLYVSGVNCGPLTAYKQMQRAKRQFQKTEGILAFHGYQSFAPGEATPEIAHAIGVKLAQELWGERFEVVVATHLDKDHLHNNFVLNSVSFSDGKRYYDNKASYALLRRTSDRLCREYASYIKDSMVSELCDLNRNLFLSSDIIPIPTDEAVREVENRLFGVETNITNWQRRQNKNNNLSAVVPYDMEQQRRESKEFLDDLTARGGIKTSGKRLITIKSIRLLLYKPLDNLLLFLTIAMEFMAT